MKKIMLTSACLLTFLLMGTAALGQSLPMVPSFGVKAGVNLADLGGDDAGETSSRVGIVVGGFASFGLSGVMNLQPEVLFTSKGAKADEDVSEDDTPLIHEVVTKLNYIQIPVLFKYGIPTAGVTKPYILFGPALAFNMSAKAKDNDADVEVDIDEFVKSTDFSAIVGVGVGVGSLDLEVRYDFGLSNIAEADEGDPSVKTRTLSLMGSFGLN